MQEASAARPGDGGRDLKGGAEEDGGLLSGAEIMEVSDVRKVGSAECSILQPCGLVVCYTVIQDIPVGMLLQELLGSWTGGPWLAPVIYPLVVQATDDVCCMLDALPQMQTKGGQSWQQVWRSC